MFILIGAAAAAITWTLCWLYSNQFVMYLGRDLFGARFYKSASGPANKRLDHYFHAGETVGGSSLHLLWCAAESGFGYAGGVVAPQEVIGRFLIDRQP
jgi:hypothetical protein